VAASAPQQLSGQSATKQNLQACTPSVQARQLAAFQCTWLLAQRTILCSAQARLQAAAGIIRRRSMILHSMQHPSTAHHNPKQLQQALSSTPVCCRGQSTSTALSPIDNSQERKHAQLTACLASYISTATMYRTCLLAQPMSFSSPQVSSRTRLQAANKAPEAAG
jgi:hypothetical protein